MPFDRRNTGTFSRNKYKKEATHPDMKGKLTDVDCPHCGQPADYALAGWAKDGNDGKWISLKVSPPYVKETGGQKNPPKPSGPLVELSGADSDLPF